MAPKKSEAGASKPKASSTSGHSYQDMIKDAIIHLKDRQGSSRHALKKYVKANNNINASDKMFDVLFNKALKAGVEKGEFSQPKGSSGGTKLAKKEPKPAAKPTAAKPTKSSTTKKDTVTKPKKATSSKSASSTKKPTTKKSVAPPKTKASTPKETAAKTKKPTVKKSSTNAPAVIDKPAVLGKTKSGRVTKTTNKTIVPKKVTPKKSAAKKTTPKKSTPSSSA